MPVYAGNMQQSKHSLSASNATPVEAASLSKLSPVKADSVRFTVKMIWAHRPFGEPDCRYVYFCDEWFWALQEGFCGGVEPWFVGWEAYAIDHDCPQCQET